MNDAERTVEAEFIGLPGRLRLSRGWFLAGALLTVFLVAALLSPQAASTYHLEVGGRALEAALGEIDPLEWWYVGPREVRDARALQRAIAHLEKAGSLSYAWRLLGRARVAQGDLLGGIEALRRFTALRPDHPLGHLELAAAYELAERHLQEFGSLDLLDVLPGAAVSAPDLEGEVAYQAETWDSEYVYPTTFPLPSAADPRPTLFLHAGARVTYTLALTQPVVLRFGMALHPQSLGWGGDGATFEAFVNGERVFLEHLTVEAARGGWQEREVDLTGYVGQTVRLSLATTPGPAGDVTADWAGWGTPRVEAPEGAAYREVVADEPWLAEWAKAGVAASDLLSWGQRARADGRYDEAEVWYERAMEMRPAWKEPYRLLGHTPRGDALALSYLMAGEPAALEKVTWLRPDDLYANYYLWKQARQSGDVTHTVAYSEALHTFSLQAIHPGDERLLDYAAAVIPALVDDGLWDREKVRNVVAFMVWQHYATPSTQQLLERLIERYPDEPAWPFYLGELYRRREELGRAEAAYREALQIDPRDARTLLLLGVVAETQAQALPTERREQLGLAARWYARYAQGNPQDLTGLRRLTRVCIALEQADLREASCQQAAQEVLDQDSTQGIDRSSPAAVLWAGWIDRAATAEPEYLVGQKLEGGWVLLGYDVDEERLIRGEMVDLVLYWAGPSPVEAGSEQEGWYRAGDRWVQVMEGVENLLWNGGFELGMAGFPHDIYKTDPTTRRLVAEMRGERRTTAGLLVNSQAYRNTSFASSYVPIHPEGLYLQAGWIKSQDGSGYLGRLWQGDIAEGVTPYNYVVGGVSPSDWQHYAGLTRPLKGAKQCQIWLINYQAEGTVYFDNVLFVEIGLPQR